MGPNEQNEYSLHTVIESTGSNCQNEVYSFKWTLFLSIIGAVK